MELITVLLSKSKLIASLRDIRLGWRWLVMANVLAYITSLFITAFNSINVQAPG
jgi:hypothetical protein